MSKTAILAIRIIGDGTSAVTALSAVDGSAASMSRTMDKASGGAALALGGLAVVASAAGDAASQLEQATGAVDSVFGKYSDKVHEYASTASTDVGLAASEYENLSAVLGAQLKNMGVDMDSLSGQSGDLIGLGADLSATFGGTTADAVAALSSLLRGERDPIERYGVSIKAADVAAKVAAMGMSGLTGEAAKAAETQATLALLTEQTADANGQFAREADTAAGQQQRANAAWQDAQAALGEQLLPVMAEGAKLLADLAKWASDNTGFVTGLAIAIGILAAGILIINGVMKAYAAVQAIATAATWASNAAWLANPIVLIILAVVAAIAIIIAIVVLVVQNWDAIAAKGAEVWAGIIQWITDLVAWLDLQKYWDAFIAGLQSIGKKAAEIWDGIVSGIQGVIGWIQDAIGWFADLFGAQTKTEGRGGSAPSSSSARTLSSASARTAYDADAAMRSATPSGSFATARVATMSLSAPQFVGARAGTPAPQQVTNVTNNYTINGAIDSDGTARTIKNVMTGDQRGTGGLPAAGVSWR